MPTTSILNQWRLVLAALLTLALAGCAGPFRSLTQEMIRSDLEGVRQRYFVPTLGVAEVGMETITTFGPVGRSGGEADGPVTPASLFQLGSCTKAMTATALAMLMQNEPVSWGSRLLEIFPEFAATANPDYRDVTLGEVASHQAGLPPASDVATWERLLGYRSSITQYVGETLRRSSWIHRGRFLYSNSGYAMLGAVIERHSGLRYSDAMNSLVFEPLGIKAHYGFPKDAGAEQPWGNTDYWGVAVKANAVTQQDAEVLAPAGSVSLTLHDFARFVQLHLRGLQGQDDSGFSAGVIKALHQPQVLTRGPFDQAYAAGWIIEKVNGETIHWHNGTMGSFYALMAINPQRKKALAVVTNVGPSQGHRVSWDILERILAD